MKKNTIDVPDWFKWAALLLLGMAVLKKVAPFLLKLTGLTAFVPDVKENTSVVVLEEKIKQQPEKYKDNSGVVLDMKKVAADAGSIRDDMSYWIMSDTNTMRILGGYNVVTFPILRSHFATLSLSGKTGWDLAERLEARLFPNNYSKIRYLWE